MKAWAILLSLPLCSLAEDATSPGAVTSPFPTMNHLAVEWQLGGDDDLDATCAVKYRRRGDSAWTSGMALHRVPAGSAKGTAESFVWTNRLSGSLFDLEPSTEYEIQLQLTDPDGGGTTQTLNAETRPEPTAAPGARPKPGDRAALKTAQPGDVILLADGDYGAAVFQRDGEPGRPIVYRSTTGKALFSEISLTGRKWVYLEGLTVTGPIRMNATEHCVVRRCSIRSQFGIKAYLPGMMNACIEDCSIMGIRSWDPAIMGAGGDNDGEGIQFTGSGNVIRYNRVQGFRDCISHMEDGSAGLQACNDIHNNDILAGLDDGIEADFAAHNCRALRNRLTNCFVGISSQPGLGGPNYFMRNVLYNVIHEAFKLHRHSIGDVLLHNTVVKAGDGLGIYTSDAFDHATVKHNLFIGGKPRTPGDYGGYAISRGRAVDVQRFGPHCVIDNNSYCVIGRDFEGKILNHTFTELPQKMHEPHGQRLNLELPFPLDPAKAYIPPDLSQLRQAGAYEGVEKAPHYGPRE
jgi:hypothetical protein